MYDGYSLSSIDWISRWQTVAMFLFYRERINAVHLLNKRIDLGGFSLTRVQTRDLQCCSLIYNSMLVCIAVQGSYGGWIVRIRNTDGLNREGHDVCGS